MLLDRLAERAALGQLVEAARGGRSAVLVVRGDAGMGKTALLEDTLAAAAGMRTARVAAVESEMELAYAALQQLCAPMLDGLERLPDPQRDALGVVFGLRAGEAPDRFLVGLAALGLLAEAVTGTCLRLELRGSRVPQATLHAVPRGAWRGCCTGLGIDGPSRPGVRWRHGGKCGGITCHAPARPASAPSPARRAAARRSAG